MNSPESTTGRAETRLSTKMLSALIMGVSGWMKAMSWYVPMPSSPRVCFMNAGFGISHIWNLRTQPNETETIFIDHKREPYKKERELFIESSHLSYSPDWLQMCPATDWQWQWGGGGCWTHKQLKKLEDPLVCENIKCIPCDRVNDRQAVNFVFDEGVNCIKKAVEKQQGTFYY